MEPVLETQVRTIDHASRTRVMVTPDMVTLRPGSGQHQLEMTKGGVQSLANFCGIPWNLAARLRPETFGTVATELLSRQERYALMIKEGAITAVTKAGDFHNLNPNRVLSAIEAGIKGVVYHRVLILNNSVVSLEIVGERREPVVEGDLVQAGTQILFSPIGSVNPTVQSYALRLACTNGATHTTILRKFYGSGGGDSGGNAGGDIYNWFKRSSRDAYNSIHPIVERYRKMMAEQVPPSQRALLLEALLGEAKITGPLANAVRAMAIENPPSTSYDLMNLLTHATSHLLENPNKIRQAQEAVADYASATEHARLCPVCHHSSKPSKN